MTHTCHSFRQPLQADHFSCWQSPKCTLTTVCVETQKHHAGQTDNDFCLIDEEAQIQDWLENTFSKASSNNRSLKLQVCNLEWMIYTGRELSITFSIRSQWWLQAIITLENNTLGQQISQVLFVVKQRGWKCPEQAVCAYLGSVRNS